MEQRLISEGFYGRCQRMYYQVYNMKIISFNSSALVACISYEVVCNKKNHNNNMHAGGSYAATHYVNFFIIMQCQFFY